MAWRTQDFGPKLNAFRTDVIPMMSPREVEEADYYWAGASSMHTVSKIVIKTMRCEPIPWPVCSSLQTRILDLFVKHGLNKNEFLKDLSKDVQFAYYAKQLLIWAFVQPSWFTETKFHFTAWLSFEDAMSVVQHFPASTFALERLCEHDVMRIAEMMPSATQFPNDPVMTRRMIVVRRRRLFALSVHVADGYLRPSGPSSAARFLRILGALPLELQHDICAMTQGVMKPTWLSIETRDCKWVLVDN